MAGPIWARVWGQSESESWMLRGGPEHIRDALAQGLVLEHAPVIAVAPGVIDEGDCKGREWDAEWHCQSPFNRGVPAGRPASGRGRPVTGAPSPDTQQVDQEQPAVKFSLRP